MPIQFSVLRKRELGTPELFDRVNSIAEQLRAHLDQSATQALLRERHVLGASSAAIQEITLSESQRLGFHSEKKGLFSDCGVTALRPDYYCSLGDTGILLEVERGKTIANNMDLLDLWKCHICSRADYLFLVVPQVRPTAKGGSTQQFSYVAKGLSPFFQEGNYVNVEAVFLFGY